VGRAEFRIIGSTGHALVIVALAWRLIRLPFAGGVRCPLTRLCCLTLLAGAALGTILGRTRRLLLGGQTLIRVTLAHRTLRRGHAGSAKRQCTGSQQRAQSRF